MPRVNEKSIEGVSLAAPRLLHQAASDGGVGALCTQTTQNWKREFVLRNSDETAVLLAARSSKHLLGDV